MWVTGPGIAQTRVGRKSPDEPSALERCCIRTARLERRRLMADRADPERCDR